MNPFVNTNLHVVIGLDAPLADLFTQVLAALSPTAAQHSDDAVLAAISAGVETVVQEIRTMSQTMSDKLDANEATLEADVTAMGDAVTAEIAVLTAELTPGSQITQAQLDRLAAIDAKVKALMPAAVAPATPPAVPPVAEPPAVTPPSDPAVPAA